MSKECWDAGDGGAGVAVGAVALENESGNEDQKHNEGCDRWVHQQLCYRNIGGIAVGVVGEDALLQLVVTLGFDVSIRSTDLGWVTVTDAVRAIEGEAMDDLVSKVVVADGAVLPREAVVNGWKVVVVIARE